MVNIQAMSVPPDRLTHLLIEEQKSGFASDSSDPIKPDGVVEI
jgi:hypothetical protein